MRWLRFAFLVLLMTILQASFVAALDIRPHLLLITLVFFAVYCDLTDAIIASFAIGLAADLIGSAVGAHMISFGLFGTLMAYLNRVMAVRKMPYQAGAIFIMGFLSLGAAHLLAYLVKDQAVSPRLHWELLWTSGCSGVIGPFLFLPMAWWMRIKVDRFGRR